MSTKQLARTVADGKLVTFRVDPEVVTGYLAGMDDYHWLVLTPSGSKLLIHKAAASVITLNDTPTYQAEPLHSELERIIRPFRDHLIEVGLIRAPRRMSISA